MCSKWLKGYRGALIALMAAGGAGGPAAAQKPTRVEARPQCEAPARRIVRDGVCLRPLWEIELELAAKAQRDRERRREPAMTWWPRSAFVALAPQPR